MKSISPVSAWHRIVKPVFALQFVTLLVMIAPLVAVVTVDSPVPRLTRLWASCLWLTALAPALNYLRTPHSSRRPIPFLPVMGVLFALYYALPAVLGAYSLHWRISIDPERDYDQPTFLAFVGWCLILVAYMATCGRPRRATVSRSPFQFEAIPTSWLFGCLFGAIGLDLLTHAVTLPAALRSIGQFTLLLQRFALCVLVILAVRGRLGRLGKLLLVIAIAALFVLQFASGSMANLAVCLLAIVCALWIERGHIGAVSVSALLVGVASLIILKGVISDFRQIAWRGEGAGGIAQQGVLLGSLVSDRIRTEGVGGAVRDGADALVGRSANLDLLADVVRRTPSEVPYWYGGSYVSLIGTLVPRVVWPTKPSKNLGQEFGHRYNYLGASDQQTSVNLPFLVEFFANFGDSGVLIGCLVVGIIYGMLDRRFNTFGQDRMTLVAGLVLVLPLLNIESDFSLIFGGLFLNAAALRGVRWWMERRLHVPASARARPFQPRATAAVASRLG